MRKKSIVAVGLLLLLIAGVPGLYAVSPKESLKMFISTVENSNVIVGKRGWLFFKEELSHLSSETFFGETPSDDPLSAIVDFNKQLQRKNIELLLVFVPPKALIYSDMLPIDLTDDIVSDFDKSYQEFYAKLNQEGVRTIDLIARYREIRETDQVYCKTDTHYSGQGIDIVAKKVAAIISAKAWYSAIKKEEYLTEYKKLPIIGDLSQMLGAKEKEELPLRFVRKRESNMLVKPDQNSPVLLLGDSHTLVFSVGGDMHTRGAGLFDNLTAELGFPLDLIGVRGSGATPSRIKLFQRSRKDDTFLRNKKLVVWCLSARELTGSGGWRKIPIEK